MLRIILFILFVANVVQPLYAQSLDVQAGTESIYLQYDFSSNNVIRTSLLYTKKHDHKDILVNVGALKHIRASNAPLEVGIGASAFYSDVIEYDVAGIAFDTKVRYFIRNLKLFIEGNVGYAPAATTFAKGERYLSLGTLIGYQRTQSVAFYTGYRDINFDVEHQRNVNLDESFFVGLSAKF